jgi:hemerythrin
MEQKVWRLQWDDSLSVGIPEIDREHQQFIQLVNELNQAIAERMEIAEIRRRMGLLLEDAERHFAHEEQWLRHWRYSGADLHAGIHAQIRRQLTDIMTLLGGQRFEPEWIAAGLEIKDILVHHLLTEDMKYRDYIRSAPDRR